MGFIESRACLSDDGMALAEELTRVLVDVDGKGPSDSAAQSYQSMLDGGIDPISLAQAILRIAMMRGDISITGTINLADLFIGDAPSPEGWESGQETLGLSFLDSQPSSDDCLSFEDGGMFSTTRFVHKDEIKKQLFIANVSVGFVKT